MASQLRVRAEQSTPTHPGRTVGGVTGRVILLAFVGSVVIVAIALATDVLTTLAVGVPLLALGVVVLVALLTPGSEGISREPVTARPAGSESAPTSARDRERRPVGVT